MILKKESMSFVNNNTISGSQLELILEKNEAKAQELTLSWIDKWNQTREFSSSQTNVFCFLNIDYKFIPAFISNTILKKINIIRLDLI